MDFDYTNIRGNYLPLVAIELKWKDQVRFKAHADSGATTSLFHASVAAMIGIDIDKGRKTEAMVADGSFIAIYLHKIPVKFCGKEFEAMIGFSKRLGSELNILGRIDFFDRFVFCFDDHNKMLSVDEIKM